MEFVIHNINLSVVVHTEDLLNVGPKFLERKFKWPQTSICQVKRSHYINVELTRKSLFVCPQFHYFLQVAKYTVAVKTVPNKCEDVTIMQIKNQNRIFSSTTTNETKKILFYVYFIS